LGFDFHYRYYKGINMTDSTDIPVLAIDGGGTRCRFALWDGQSRHVIEAGPANAFTDFDATLACLKSGLQTLSGATKLQQKELFGFPAFVGLAGVTSDTIAGRLRACLPLRHAHYADDRPAALRGALGDQDGMIAHCGTGSFFGAQAGGVYRVAGGWGALLGDEASAQWVGRKALAATLRHADGFGAPSPLTDALSDRFQGSDGILLFARGALPDALGALAPLVTEHAKNEDPAARAILMAGADYIANGLDQMGWTPGLPVCLTGGIGPEYRAYLPTRLQRAVIAPLGVPLDGALALARDQAREVADGYC
jgi:glucosamine kinase